MNIIAISVFVLIIAVAIFTTIKTSRKGFPISDGWDEYGKYF